MNIKLSDRFKDKYEAVCDVIDSIDVEYKDNVIDILDVYINRDQIISACRKNIVTLICNERQLIKTLMRLKEYIDENRDKIDSYDIIREVFVESIDSYTVNEAGDEDEQAFREMVDELMQTSQCSETYKNERKLKEKIQKSFVAESMSTTWNVVSKDNLPEVGEPVIVLLTNGCVSIDWVNEPIDEKCPFQHYLVRGWTPLNSHAARVVKTLIKFI